MTSPSKSSFDFEVNSYYMLHTSMEEQSETQKLQEYLAHLEEERLKIEAFKRELPLCMQIVNNAMKVFKQQLESSRRNSPSVPIIKEFIPMNFPSYGSSEKESKLLEKSNKLKSLRLWNNDGEDEEEEEEATKQSSSKTDKIYNLFTDYRHKNEATSGSFTSEICPPKLALGLVEKIEKKQYEETENKEQETKVRSDTSGELVTNSPREISSQERHNQRKTRRCWSPELHRRFVNALQLLGGSQVATPKQIRELMQVDGLTNDEVKSHLQKYRLHSRRPGTTHQMTAPQLLVLGGIWVPPEYRKVASYGAETSIFSPHCASNGYNHLYNDHYQHHNSPFNDCNSYEFDMKLSRDRSESVEEDGQSDIGGWKGKNLKKLNYQKERSEDSNQSNVILKF